jgi:hypothetical protein
MLSPENLKEALEAFRGNVIRQARGNLTRQRKNVTRTLYNSIQGSEVNVTENSLQFNISMADYGTFQDLGVSGIKTKYDTPYTYRDKMPPSSVFDGWGVRRGIAPRDEKGRFLNRKSLNYLIARSIYLNGIKPSLFFTTPFKKYYKDLPEEIATAFALDIKQFIQFVNKQNFQ